jgi:hypothetical protein
MAGWAFKIVPPPEIGICKPPLLKTAFVDISLGSFALTRPYETTRFGILRKIYYPRGRVEYSLQTFRR